MNKHRPLTDSDSDPNSTQLGPSPSWLGRAITGAAVVTSDFSSRVLLLCYLSIWPVLDLRKNVGDGKTTPCNIFHIQFY